MTITYSFSWAALSRRLALGLAWRLGLDMDHPSDALEEAVGPEPTVQLVHDAADVVVDRFLEEDEAAMSAVLGELDRRGVKVANALELVEHIQGSVETQELIVSKLYFHGRSPGPSPYQDLPKVWRSEATSGDIYNIVALQQSLRERLLVDDEWVVVDGASWSWWVTPTPIDIYVGEPRLVLGDASYRVAATCRLVHEIERSDEEVMEWVAWRNQTATLFAFVYEEEARAISVRTAYTAHAGNEAMEKAFSFALVMMANASLAAPMIAEEVDGKVAIREHPISGVRTDADELALFVDRQVVPGGLNTSPYTDDIAGMTLVGWPGCAWEPQDVGDSHVLQAELSIHHNLAALVSGELDLPLGTALFRADPAVLHPAIGSGALLTLRLPDLFDGASAAHLANDLNRRESEEPTGFTYMGAWCRDALAEDGVAFTLFLPATFYIPGLASVMVSTFLDRTAWIADEYAS